MTADARCEAVSAEETTSLLRLAGYPWKSRPASVRAFHQPSLEAAMKSGVGSSWLQPRSRFLRSCRSASSEKASISSERVSIVPLEAF